MTEQEQIQAYQLALCLAEKECPSCGGNKTVLRVGEYDEESVSCSRCHGSGRVPLLSPELVREKCPTCGFYTPADRGFHEFRAGCPSCQSRGWIPSTDISHYLHAIYELWKDDVRKDGTLVDIVWSLYGSELLCYQALGKALGVNYKLEPEIDLEHLSAEGILYNPFASH
uniref:Putative tryptophan operon leader n=1 Tax=viral metagenome TaxID=1070528 RepID=A0A6M3LPP0_9ZZZZ